MRKANLRKTHEQLDGAVARYRAFMEKVVGAQRVIGKAQEKQDIAESVLLRLCANWERFIDEHLVACVNRDSSKLSEHYGGGVPKHASKRLCRALLFGDGYRDFYSFGALKGYSKKILPESGNPFLHVAQKHTNKLDEAFKLRNYLAHYSHKGKVALARLYEKQYKMSRFLEPGQFLLAYNGRRLWAYFAAFEGASRDMKSSYDRM